MKILLATDGSESSNAAAALLKKFEFGPGTEVIILHVLRDYIISEAAEYREGIRKAGKSAAEALSAEVRTLLPGPPVRISSIIKEGEPWHEILEAARAAEADLMVMGHRGMSGLNRFLIGSVSSQVVRHADRPVLVVRAVPPASRPMRVLFCTDGTPSSCFACGLMEDLPLPADCDVQVMSVVDMEVTSMPEKYYPEEDVSKMMASLRDFYLHQAESAVESAVRELSERFLSVKGRVTFGIPEAEILKTAEETGADLVVMGGSGHRGIRGFLLGSVSYRVIKHASCSVLVARRLE